MNDDSFDKLLNYKLKILKNTTNERARQSIEFEIKSIKEIESERLKIEKKYKELHSSVMNVSEAKAIAEMVCLIHGVPAYIIEIYYRMGLEATLSVLEDLSGENEVIIPPAIKKYIKK